MQTLDVEIIEFKRPLSCENNLFIGNIPQEIEEEELDKFLRKTFSKYGLLYEVQVIATVTEAVQDNEQAKSRYYAFVKFYSGIAAARAKKDLTGRLYVKGCHLKVCYSRRKSTLNDIPNLYVSKCYELANYYLGFDGWTSRILSMKPDEASECADDQKVRIICVVQINLPKHNLHTEALGLGQEKWSKTERTDQYHKILDTRVIRMNFSTVPNSRGIALAKAKKEAYRRAVEHAWRKVVLVVLCDGRLHVEVNTTIEETQHFSDDLNLSEMLKVTELEVAAECDTEGDADDDDINMQILQELEEENS